MRVSSPSSENCFCPRNARRRYCSKPFGLREALEQRETLLRSGSGRAEAAGLDRLSQPHPLGVIGDVLDLVGDRAGIDVAQQRQRITERLTGDEQAQEAGGDPLLQLGRERRLEAELVERGIARRLGPEGIEPRREMTVHPDRLDERHRRGDAAQQLLVERGAPSPLAA